MKIDTHLNILISYAYMTNTLLCNRVRKIVNARKANIMIDSGAFTKVNAKGEFKHINLQDYCRFLHKYGDMAEKYVMLDVVGNAQLTKQNYLAMVKDGLNPMFVVTMYDNDFDFISDAIKKNPNICVAGGATTKSTWMQKRYQDIFRLSNKKALIHGLAYVTYPKMMQLPLSSVDSSSWKAASLRFGALQYFNKGLKSVHYKNVLQKKSKLSLEQQAVLRNLKITPSMFCNIEYHKGNYSMEALAGLQANIMLQKVCKRNNLNYFLAASNLVDIEKILYVNDNFNDLSYEKFRKEFAK